MRTSNVKATIQPADGPHGLTGTRGHLARYVIHLRNASPLPVRFGRCPLLAGVLAPAGQTEVHQLNCSVVRPIPPGGRSTSRWAFTSRPAHRSARTAFLAA